MLKLLTDVVLLYLLPFLNLYERRIQNLIKYLTKQSSENTSL